METKEHNFVVVKDAPIWTCVCANRKIDVTPSQVDTPRRGALWMLCPECGRSELVDKADFYAGLEMEVPQPRSPFG